MRQQAIKLTPDWRGLAASKVVDELEAVVALVSAAAALASAATVQLFWAAAAGAAMVAAARGCTCDNSAEGGHGGAAR